MKLQNNCNFGGGASGGPWIDSSGSVVALTSQQISDCGIFCGTYNTGAYMGASAEAQFDAAQAVSIQPPPPVTSAYKYAMIDSEDEYSGPSESTSVLQALPKGTAVYLTCQQAGADVEGSAVWDRLTNGGWVPD